MINRLNYARKFKNGLGIAKTIVSWWFTINACLRTSLHYGFIYNGWIYTSLGWPLWIVINFKNCFIYFMESFQYEWHRCWSVPSLINNFNLIIVVNHFFKKSTYMLQRVWMCHSKIKILFIHSVFYYAS